jgi:tRNA threonylcarbamoyladenosine biosynthesis protein TsaB
MAFFSSIRMMDTKAPLILAIETATRAGSVALARGQEILWTASGEPAASHSTDLIETIERTLKNSDVSLGEVDVFAAARGPGSFTGLRIGLATIKSFAVCKGKTCAGVSTLAAIAHAAGDSENTVALLPAGRGELFAQMFSVREGDVRELDSASHLKPETVLKKYDSLSDLRWAGEGARLYAELLRDSASAHEFAFNEEGADGLKQSPRGWVIAAQCEQLATSVASLALTDYRNEETISPEKLQADYVRASDAEINERWQSAK